MSDRARPKGWPKDWDQGFADPPVLPDHDGSSWDCAACGTNVIGPSVAPPCPHCGAAMQRAKAGA